LRFTNRTHTYSHSLVSNPAASTFCARSSWLFNPRVITSVALEKSPFIVPRNKDFNHGYLLNFYCQKETRMHTGMHTRMRPPMRTHTCRHTGTQTHARGLSLSLSLSLVLSLTQTHTTDTTPAPMRMHIHARAGVCVCVCVCEREREREREIFAHQVVLGWRAMTLPTLYNTTPGS
jgi:hypothetical protein